MARNIAPKRLPKRFVFNIVLAILSAVVYAAAYISPALHGWAGFAALLIPLFILMHGVMFLHWLTQKSWYLLLSLAMLLLSYPFLESSFAFHGNGQAPRQADSSFFRVLSYNVRVFNVYSHLQDKDSASSKAMINWVAEHEAEIKCLQELYNDDSSTVFSTLRRISRQGKYNYFLTPVPHQNKNKGGYFGLAIFSKYPIIHSGELAISPSKGNRSLFIDTVIGSDTLRVYNVHLQSMSIDEERLLRDESYQEAKNTYRDLARRLYKGFRQRALQVEALEQHIAESPYPAIVCGDFNDVPYSYTYRRMRRKLENAFERAGKGFGFSYNGKLFFLRIDHQFYDSRLQIHSFHTSRHVPYSDHFPLSATYSFR